MSTPAPAGDPAALHLLADLDVEVDGTAVRVTGDGSTLAVHVADPAVALAGLPVGAAGGIGGIGRRTAVTALGQLRRAGVTVEISGPDGPLVSVGAVEYRGRPGRLLRRVPVRVDGLAAAGRLARLAARFAVRIAAARLREAARRIRRARRP